LSPGHLLPAQQAPSLQVSEPAAQVIAQVAPLQRTPWSQASSPSHWTLHVPFVQTTPFLHALSPKQLTSQLLAEPQSTPQLQAPVMHVTRHGMLGGHLTNWQAPLLSEHLITHVPAWT
jgi:hypothetical protein